MKTARYTHKDTCEGKPSNIIEKTARKNNETKGASKTSKYGE